MRRERYRYRTQRKYLLYIILAGFGVFFLVRVLPAFGTYSSVVFQMLLNREIALKKTQDRVNILLLGIGGGTHEGPNLTDTIIFASIDPKMQQITLVSIPRDLWIPELQAKINTAYAIGKEKRKDGGLTLAKAVVKNVLGQPIDYAIRIDFNGFVKAIDMLGGLEINVDRVLDDYAYPIAGKEDDTCGHTEEDIADLSMQIATQSATEFEAFPCRFEHIYFAVGQQHMDGQTALKFVRSRHALGIEGSDFARSKRQEKVISAFKDKVFSVGTILNPVKLVSLYEIFKDSIDTDIRQEEYDDFIKLAQKMKEAKIVSVALDFGDPKSKREGLLVNPPMSNEFKGQWVIIPKEGNGNYQRIQQYVSCSINSSCLSPTPRANQ
jgi:LCP family protein required for cell wall assembly